MEKQTNLSIKQFYAAIRKALKRNYSSALGAIIGLFVVAAILIGILGFAAYMLLRELSLQYMMMMYGMSSISSMLIYGLGMVLVLILYIILLFFIQFFKVAIQFNLQDGVRDASVKVKFRAIYGQFKRLKKWQLVRLSLWTWLFMTLWQLPFEILNTFFGSNSIIAAILKALLAVVTIWKTVEYSQSIFLYREKQPKFLGQSMRHALTVSRRFMGGRKVNYIILMIAGYVPVIVWGLLWAAIIYMSNNFGSFAMPSFITWLFAIILVVGVCAYLPVLLIMEPVFYEANKLHLNLDEEYDDTFLPQEKLVDPLPDIKEATSIVPDESEIKAAKEAAQAAKSAKSSTSEQKDESEKKPDTKETESDDVKTDDSEDSKD